MSEEQRKNDAPLESDGTLRKTGEAALKDPAPLQRQLVPLPGLAAIALYLVLLAAVIVVGVMTGHYHPFLLVLPVVLIAASGGLLMRFRWAWAMALAAAVLLSGYEIWLFASSHLLPGLIQGLLNLVIFFYLVRTEVREKLR